MAQNTIYTVTKTDVKKRKSFGSKGRKKDRQMDRKRDNKTKRIMKRKWCNGSDMMFELKIRWPVRLKG